MFAKKVAIFLVLLSSLVVTSLAGYFTGLKYSNDIAVENKDTQKGDKVSVAASSIQQPKPPSIAIGTSTQIVKQHKYIKGIEYTKLINENAGPEILGMDFKTAEKHFMDRGYLIVSFDSDKVILSKRIDSWAPETYVLKSDNNVMTIYKVNANGELTEPKATPITLDILPEHDKQEIIKGKTFETIEEAEALVEEYDS